MATKAAMVALAMARSVESAANTTATAPKLHNGLLSGVNPTVYDPSNPIILFTIQACIILCVCRVLHFPLGYLHQPRVIGEVIGGIILGPSVMGHVPGFTNTIFPAVSIPNLNNVANLGLILFLFIIGLEVDIRIFFGNWKMALSVAAAGMTLPFGLGAAIAHGLFHQFANEPGTVPVAYGTFLLFVGVAMAITAFPVLCRILTELKLLGTTVGIVTLGAGVSDDVVGWVLLALCIALVNASSGITALYIVLAVIGWACLLLLVVRPIFMWVLRHTHSLQDGPNQGVMVLTVLLCLGSAFFTGAVGVHPMFGAFLAGLMCPHEGGFAIKVTEKIEDLMSALFLPLYFTLSGLSTNLGLLNNAITWGYLIAVVSVAFCGKFFGCTLAAKLNGLIWREAFTIGSLMSCKGLVELIVLNIGLQAKILSTRVFTMFVVMALVTTFATTPLTSALYPPWYQRKLAAWKRGEIDWETGNAIKSGNSTSDIEMVYQRKNRTTHVRNLLVYLRLDNMPNTLAFVSLFGARSGMPAEKMYPLREEKNEPAPLTQHSKKATVQVHGVRIAQLTARTTSVMAVTEVGELSAFDPVLNAFRVLGQLYNLAVSGEVAIVPEDSFAETLTTKAFEEESDLLLLPWTETGSLSEAPMVSRNTIEQKLRSDAYSRFVEEAFRTSKCTTAVFVNKAFSGSLEQSPATLSRRLFSKSSPSVQRIAELPTTNQGHHIFMPFFGGADGRQAICLTLQLAENPDVTVTIVHYQIKVEGTRSEDAILPKSVHEGISQISVFSSPTKYGDDDFFVTVQHTLPAALRARVSFRTSISYDPVSDAVTDVRSTVGQNSGNGGNVVILGRNTDMAEAQSSSCLGLMADIMLERNIDASVVVVQARKE